MRPPKQVGKTTDDIDKLVHKLALDNGAYPSPLHYKGFPKSVCTSVNNVACHGIPDDRPLEDGDIINIDVTVYLNGFHGDCSSTFLVGNVDEKGRKLVQVTEECLYRAIEHCKPGRFFNSLDNVYPGRMLPGMTFTIEPVIAQGSENIVILEDGWTAVMEDTGRAAQFEHTVLITETGVEVLTQC
uniref:Peptidase M24 domain-containing protein n=1 Tax=Timema monikensis TaxID=170555 RepID=A0A7R9HIP8_9NEOP|nr:unnamed protein product [Timema monikensis]